MASNALKQEFSADSGEFLTFILGGEEYGVDTVSYTHLTLPTIYSV